MPHKLANKVANAFRVLRRALQLLLLTLGFAFLLVTFTPLVRWLVQACEPDWYSGNGEVLVVLGGSMLMPGLGNNATLGHDTYLRCVYAGWILQHQTFQTVVITGDSGAAEQVARSLAAAGVAVPKIVVENRATSTFENALYTKNLLSTRYQGKLPQIVILTSDYHAWRARRVFQRVGFRVKTIPVPDILKRFGAPLERWPAFLLLLKEFSKDLAYAATGKL